MKIPYKIKKDNKVYIYQKQCNKNLFLYKEEKTGFRECFLLQDIIEYKNEKKKNRSKNMILIKELIKLILIILGEFIGICFFIALIERWKNK